MKTCSKCKEEKNFNLFVKRNDRKIGYTSRCKACLSSNRIKNQNFDRQYMIEYWEQYKVVKKKELGNYQKKYRQNNKAKLLANNSKRRASRLKATPSWLTKEQLQEIKEFYEIAAAFKLYTGQDYQVDHIVPLQNSLVCGLHVPWNLQILTAQENITKSNKLIQ